MEVTFSINLWWVVGPLLGFLTVLGVARFINYVKDSAYQRYHRTVMHATSNVWVCGDPLDPEAPSFKLDTERREVLIRLPYGQLNSHLSAEELFLTLRYPSTHVGQLRRFADLLGVDTFMALANASGNLELITELMRDGEVTEEDAEPDAPDGDWPGEDWPEESEPDDESEEVNVHKLRRNRRLVI